MNLINTPIKIYKTTCKQFVIFTQYFFLSIYLDIFRSIAIE